MWKFYLFNDSLYRGQFSRFFLLCIVSNDPVMRFCQCVSLCLLVLILCKKIKLQFKI